MVSIVEEVWRLECRFDKKTTLSGLSIQINLDVMLFNFTISNYFINL